MTDELKFSNIDALGVLKEHMKARQERWANEKLVNVGEFTYAWTPLIKSWGEGAKLKIGKYCSIAGNVQFFLGGDHRIDWLTTYPFAELMPNNYNIPGSPKSKGDIVIGNDVWIGNDAKIFSGVHIGDGAVIAGSAVVTKNVQAYDVVGGVPAQHLKWRFPMNDIVKVWRLEWWDWPLDKIAAAVPILQSSDVEALVEFDRRWGNE